MKFEYTGQQTYGTRWYKVFAEKGETLTKEAIKEAIPNNIAPWGCRVEYNKGTEALVAAYVD